MKRTSALVAASMLLSMTARATDGACPAESASAIGPVAAAVASAATFTNAPGVDAFAKAWTRGFAGCVRRFAGDDKRLTRNEVAKMADDERCGVYADNATNWLDKAGQQSVSVNKLIPAASRYAWATANKAAGDDGRLSLADGKKLPADLQADYARLRGIGIADDGAPAVAREELPASSPLRKKVEDVATEWGDENIMNGQATVTSGRVKPVSGAASEEALASVGRGVLDEYAAADELDLKDVKSSTLTVSKGVAEASKALACDGFVYDCSASNFDDNVGPVKDKVSALVKKLGDASDVRVVQVAGRSKIEGSSGDDDDGKLWRAATYTFVNVKTGELVSFYAREGWI